MHRGDLAKELAPWAGHGDKFLKALRIAYVLGTEHALAIAVKTAMGDDENPGEWESIECLVPKLLVQKSVAEEKKKSAGNKGKPAHTQKVKSLLWDQTGRRTTITLRACRVVASMD